MNEESGVPRSEVVGGDGVNMMPTLTGRVLARLETVLKSAMTAKSFNRQLLQNGMTHVTSAREDEEVDRTKSKMHEDADFEGFSRIL